MPVEARRTSAIVVLACGGVDIASWPLAACDCHGLSVVDELARLQLAAGRLGCAIRLREASPRLTELLDLAGLAEVVPARLRGEVRGEPEGGEQVGVEEAVVPDDPVA